MYFTQGFYHAIYNCGCGYELQDENPIHHTIRINSYKKYFVLTWENRREVLEFVQNHDICNAGWYSKSCFLIVVY